MAIHSFSGSSSRESCSYIRAVPQWESPRLARTRPQVRLCHIALFPCPRGPSLRQEVRPADADEGLLPCLHTSSTGSKQARRAIGEGSGVKEAGFSLSLILSLLPEHERMLFALLYSLSIIPPGRKAGSEFYWYLHHLHIFYLSTASIYIYSIFCCHHSDFNSRSILKVNLLLLIRGYPEEIPQNND